MVLYYFLIYSIVFSDLNKSFLISQVAAQTGHNVVMVDIDKVAVSKAQERITSSIQRVAKKKFGDDKDAASLFVKDSLGRLSISTDSSASVANADLVVEAIVENLDIKQKLFSQLDKVWKSIFYIIIIIITKVKFCNESTF